MTWAAKRRATILGLIIVVLGGLGLLFYAPVIFKTPTCSDGKQNGSETGVDCGGNCVRSCSAEIKLPTVLWTRSFSVTESVYNAVAYIENQNSAATRAISYEFRLYDEDDIFITRVQGDALIPPSGRYAIFEPSISVGSATVRRTSFSFLDRPAVWERLPEEVQDLRVSTTNISLSSRNGVPRLEGTVSNPSAEIALYDTEVVAILYDKDDNAITASRTYIDTLRQTESLPVFFTWPRPLESEVVRFELVPIIDVFAAGR